MMRWVLVFSFVFSGVSWAEDNVVNTGRVYSEGGEAAFGFTRLSDGGIHVYTCEGRQGGCEKAMFFATQEQFDKVVHFYGRHKESSLFIKMVNYAPSVVTCILSFGVTCVSIPARLLLDTLTDWTQKEPILLSTMASGWILRTIQKQINQEIPDMVVAKKSFFSLEYTVGLFNSRRKEDLDDLCSNPEVASDFFMAVVTGDIGTFTGNFGCLKGKSIEYEWLIPRKQGLQPSKNTVKSFKEDRPFEKFETLKALDDQKITPFIELYPKGDQLVEYTKHYIHEALKALEFQSYSAMQLPIERAYYKALSYSRELQLMDESSYQRSLKLLKNFERVLQLREILSKIDNL